MKRFLTGLALVSTLFVSAQESSKALLWSISGNGLEQPGYLYGTVHSKDERAYTYAAAVEDAMKEVNTVAGELDLDASRKGAVSMMSRMMMPDDQRLQDLYKKKDWAKVDAYLKSELGFMAIMVQRMKPFFVMATLTETAMGGKREMVLDEYLMAHAKANAHRTIGLETLEEQLIAMDALSLKEQAAMLLEHVEEGGMRDVLDQMLDAYAQQDIETLTNISESVGNMPEKLERALLMDRNVVMAHRMDSVLRADGRSMFLVGAMHLPGETGMLHLLRAKGYSTVPVVMDVSSKEPLFKAAMNLEGGIRYTNDTLGFRVDMPGVPDRVGERMIGFKQEGRGVLVVVDMVEGDIKELDIEDLIAEQYGNVVLAPTSTRMVQGQEAQVVTMDMKGTPADIMLVQLGSTTFFVAAVDADQLRRQQVLDSFRMNDLPE